MESSKIEAQHYYLLIQNHESAPIFGLASPSRLDRTLRVKRGDFIHFRLPGGHKFAQKRPLIRLTLGNGWREEIEFDSRDASGAGEAIFEAKCTGPVSACLVCEPFAAAATGSVATTESAAREESSYDPEAQGQLVSPLESGRLVVESTLALYGDVYLPSSGLMIATVVSQRLGKFEEWLPRLSILCRQKFNAIHFTPVQELGQSKSSYSIADPLQVSRTFCGNDNRQIQGEWPGWDILASDVLSELYTKHGILSFTDIVLNHISADADFLRRHPEAGYHEENSPWLKSAIELDNAIKVFNRRLVDGELQGVSAHINSEDDLNRLVHTFEEVCLQPLKIHTWFLIDVARNVSLFEGQRDKNAQRLGNDEAIKVAEFEATKLIGPTESKAGIVLPIDILSILAGDSMHLRHILTKVQEKLWTKKNEVYSSILNNVRGTVRYERLEQRKGPIETTPYNSMVPPYFTEVHAEDGKTYHLANNGWVMDWSCKNDFTAPGYLVYLSRALVAWSDCVKLRYGSKPEDNPALWDLMERYCRLTSAFAGVRLDNCHTTPLHVGQHMVKVCRQANPNIFIFAELFTGNQFDDVNFEEALGLDAIVREAVQTTCPNNQSWHAFKFTQLRGLGGVPQESIALNWETNGLKELPSRRCVNIFYDCTHDNETPFEKNRPNDALACAALACASGCAVGSVLGYEVSVKKNPSVIADGALYPLWPVAKEPEELLADAARGGRDETDEGSDEEGFLRVEWHGAADDVKVWGDFNGWKEPLSLQQTSVGNWSVRIPQSDKKVTGKFVIDGRWVVADNYPRTRDEHGNENNILSAAFGAADAYSPKSSAAREGLKASVGIVEGRRVLNKLHQQLAMEGFDEIKITHIGDDCCVLSRFQPHDGRVYHFIVRSHWWKGPDCPPWNDLTVEGRIKDVVLCCHMSLPLHSINAPTPGARSIAAFGGKASSLHSLPVPGCRYDADRDATVVSLTRFPSGSVLVLEGVLETRPQMRVAAMLDEQLAAAVGQLDLGALNYVMFSCDREERDRSDGKCGVYAFPPPCEPVVFAGFTGVADAINQSRAHVWAKSLPNPAPALEDQGFYGNTIAGDWLLDYHWHRLSAHPKCKALADLVKHCALPVSNSPIHQLKAVACDVLFSRLTTACLERVFELMPGWIRAAKDVLPQMLAVATLQLCGSVKSSRLPQVVATELTTSAGLPFFSAEYMREWGRDTFLALPGLYLATGRWEMARQTIVAYASVMRHAMIPNLLDSGNNPRFNARDAVWFWLQAIKEYYHHAPDGPSILAEKVQLKYPEQLIGGKNPQMEPPQNSAAGTAEQTANTTTVLQLIKHTLSAHATGISFREVNAGLRLDSQMTDAGFNVEVRFDKSTGLLLGGNIWNCGTWMDKMGSSEKAGNKGKPSSPRDGAPVELTCACYSSLKWLCEELHLANTPLDYDATTEAGEPLTYGAWFQLLKNNFSDKYWIPKSQDGAYNNAAVGESYKDVYGGTREEEDYYMRCNYSYGLSLAPEIDSLERIGAALETAFAELVPEPNQVGMKTLNARNPRFRPNYDNSNDSHDINVAHGWNYHQGPEWVWPMGSWMQAALENLRLKMMAASAKECGRSLEAAAVAAHALMGKLGNVRNWIQKSPWFSLPELMDNNGRVCRDSCQSQAWSIGTFLWFYCLLMTKYHAQFSALYRAAAADEVNHSSSGSTSADKGRRGPGGSVLPGGGAELSPRSSAQRTNEELDNDIRDAVDASSTISVDENNASSSG